MCSNSCSKEGNIEKEISYICNCEYDYFLNKKNVQGVGFGYKFKNGFYTNQLCIQVFVSQKISCNYIAMQDIIPQMYKGIPTDVVETGIATTSSLTQKTRPAIGGYAIGNDYDTTSSSTLGCLVTNGKDYFILGNNHTIASVNQAPLGTKIMQPSVGFGGNLHTDTIGNLTKYIPIKFKTFFRRPSNYVDCAMAKVVNKSLVSPEIAKIGIPKETVEPQLDLQVKKTGFRSELTIGRIVSMHISIILPYRQIGKRAMFKEQVMATYMSGPGDSGSLMLTKDNNAVGLIMANVTNGTIFNPINTVLKALNVRIVTKWKIDASHH